MSEESASQEHRQRFRPLAGISCVIEAERGYEEATSFRPLAGISCVQQMAMHPCPRCRTFPSPRGDKLCPDESQSAVSRVLRFRPLAGISCVSHLISTCITPLFPSPRGDKLCLQNCPTGACGIGPGSDRITISHSTATGKWQLEIKIPLIFLREPLQTAMQVAAMETRFAQSADSH